MKIIKVSVTHWLSVTVTLWVRHSFNDSPTPSDHHMWHTLVSEVLCPVVCINCTCNDVYMYICACPLSMSDVETGMIVEGSVFCMESGQTAKVLTQSQCQWQGFKFIFLLWLNKFRQSCTVWLLLRSSDVVAGMASLVSPTSEMISWMLEVLCSISKQLSTK